MSYIVTYQTSLVYAPFFESWNADTAKERLKQGSTIYNFRHNTVINAYMEILAKMLQITEIFALVVKKLIDRA